MMRQLSILRRSNTQLCGVRPTITTKYDNGWGLVGRRGAAFWKVGTNFQIFKQMLKDSGSSEWKFRLLLFLGIFIVLNFLFNIMMAVLTNVYLDTLQPTSRKFGMLVNSEYKHGLVEESINYDDQLANKRYLKCLRMLARDNGLVNEYTDKKQGQKFDESSDPVYDISQIVLTSKELDKWYYEKRDVDYIAAYVDLLLRFALTLPSQQTNTVYTAITKALGLSNSYSKLAHQQLGTYSLVNKALRTKADILNYRKEPFSTIESCFLGAIRIVEDNQFHDEYPMNRDVTIVPEKERSSDLLTNSLLDLCSFYSDTRDPKYLSKALTILVSELKSLENEAGRLNKIYNSNAMAIDPGSVSTPGEQRIMELEYEKIPLVKMETSEILWFGNKREKAIEMARDSAQKASLYSSANFNSAKIAKLGFTNLAQMYQESGDDATAQLCQSQADKIEIPMDAFSRKKHSVRHVVLEYWFGPWGSFLFPG